MKKCFIALITSLAFWVGSTTPTFAGTDLTITCTDNGPCAITPAATPLFSETNIAPGATRTQNLTIVNNDNEACGLVATLDDETSGQTANLATQMFGAITNGLNPYWGTVSGGQAQSGATYQNLFDQGTLALGTLPANSSAVYTWYATFNPEAGNEYQGVQTIFDFGITITCGTPTASPSPSGSVAGSTTSTSGGGGSSGPAPVCTANPPASAPSVTITNVGVNTVSLAWTGVSPVTHYALIFTRNSDGAQYGSTNIGNVTSYTITNLSGGAGYTFEVFGINDCAPGPRGTAVSGIVGGAVIEGRPLGPEGAVLGTSDETEATPSPSPSPAPGSEGEVAGAIDEVCRQGREYLPWLLLLLQVVLIFLAEWYWRHDPRWTKHFVTVGVTLLSIALFYWLRHCDCYSGGFLAWLCRWYWVVSLLLTLLERVISYAFIEDLEPEA